MSEVVPVRDAAAANKGGKGMPMPPPKGLGKGVPPPKPGGAPGKGVPMLPRGALHRPPSSELLGPKLRPLFWTAVSQVPVESVWADLVEPAPFDKALLERQFALADSRTPSSTKAATAPGSRSASEEPRKRVRVLDDRTSQLLAIAFNRLPPPERVAEMVDALEDFPDGLTTEAVLALHNAVSEHREAVEQIRLVASNQETIAQLDMPERFLLRLTSVDFCDAKLACGALIVGSAKELMDLRLSGQKVGVCCQELRKSKLLQKCMSTALAVGNFLNRGTARSGVRGVVLPEALLKMEELRGGSLTDSVEDRLDKDKAGGSLLDFVAQAIVNEEAVNIGDLQKDAENLLAKARAAAGVALEETHANCRQVNAEATKTRDALREVPISSCPGASRMMQRVERVYEEAVLAVEIAEKAQDQLAKAQTWSCCKNKVKSNEWFSSWVQFLELLPRALARAQEAKVRAEAAAQLARQQPETAAALEEAEQRAQLQRPPLSDVNVEDPGKRRHREICSALAPMVHAALAPTKKAGSGSPEAASSRGRSKALDDDARIDDIDWSKLNQMRQEQENPLDQVKRHSESAIRTSFDDKENSVH